MSSANSGPDNSNGSQPDEWVLSLRMPKDRADLIKAMAAVNGKSITKEILAAIEAHIEAARQDTEFQERLQASLTRNQAILERLSNG